MSNPNATGNPNWVKGRSGNPTGRPKENNEVKELARQWTTEAIKRLVYWMKSDNPKASVTAAQTLLDRGHGKPMQQLDIRTGPLDNLETAELLELQTFLTASRAQSDHEQDRLN